jgi:hypothetical protein
MIRRIDNAVLFDSGLDLLAQRFCQLCHIHPTDEPLHLRQGIQCLNGLDFHGDRKVVEAFLV